MKFSSLWTLFHPLHQICVELLFSLHSFRCLSNKDNLAFSNSDMPALRKLMKMEILQGRLSAPRSIPTALNNQPVTQFNRRFLNPNSDSCWINSMIQMILTAMDHSDDLNFKSALGIQLTMIQFETVVDPKPFKVLLQNEKEKYSTYDSSENIVYNQQDAKEFVSTLSLYKENEAWNDVCNMIQHKLLETFTCMQCEHKTQRVLEAQLFQTIELPPNNIKLKRSIQKCFNDSDEYPEKRWDDHESDCVGATRKVQIITKESSSLLMININRDERSVRNRNDASDDLILVDDKSIPRTFELIAAVEHIGNITSEGADQGHYICDVKYHADKKWYRTDDEKMPKLIEKQKVTKRPYILLYRRK